MAQLLLLIRAIFLEDGIVVILKSDAEFCLSNSISVTDRGALLQFDNRRVGPRFAGFACSGSLRGSLGGAFAANVVFRILFIEAGHVVFDEALSRFRSSLTSNGAVVGEPISKVQQW